MKRNMLTRREGSLLFVRQNNEDATEADWNEFLGFLSDNRRELTSIRILILTDGGSPAAAQRKRLAETLGDTHMLVAAVSDSIRVRFAGATISLFQRNYRQFTVKELPGAYEHLRLTPSERRARRSCVPGARGKARSALTGVSGRACPCQPRWRGCTS